MLREEHSCPVTFKISKAARVLVDFGASWKASSEDAETTHGDRWIGADRRTGNHLGSSSARIDHGQQLRVTMCRLRHALLGYFRLCQFRVSQVPEVARTAAKPVHRFSPARGLVPVLRGRTAISRERERERVSV